MKKPIISRALLGALLLAAALGGALSACEPAKSAWLRPQGELVQLARAAGEAKPLATDLRTLAALDLCITSAQKGVHSYDELLQAEEALRQAKRKGVEIPELQDRVKQATRQALAAEAAARKDCAGAGVRAVALPAAPRAAPDGGGGAADGPVVGARDSGGAARDLAEPAPAADLGADGGR